MPVSLLKGAAVDFVARHGTVARDRTDSSYERPLVLRQPSSAPAS
jgi:hypothetical protein